MFLNKKLLILSLLMLLLDYFFSADDKDSPLGKTCGIYASLFGRPISKNQVSFCSTFEKDFTDTFERQKTWDLNDVYKNLEQKQLTSPDCLNEMNFQLNFLPKMEKIDLNFSLWSYLRIASKHDIVSKIEHIGRTSYIPFQLNHKSIVITNNTNDSCCAVWCI